MNRRDYTVDLLRGLAIVGMVLSGQILWHAELPAWLFHAQTPPPTFAFDPSVAGITWVDLVFPFFLFSMGAAFPLAMRKRLDVRGESVASLIVGVLKRWALLALFAIALANLRPGVMGDMHPALKSVLQLLGWGCFGAMFLRLDRFSARQNRTMTFAGIGGLVALLLAEKYIWGIPVSVGRSDVIILVLANMALFGSVVWIWTRNNLLARLGVLALLAALRLGSTVEGSWDAALWEWSPVGWLFRFEYLKYLCIIIPGTIVGDCIWRWMQAKEEPEVLVKSAAGGELSRAKALGVALLLLGLVCVNMWGLFARCLAVNLVATLVLGFAVRQLLRGGSSPLDQLHRELFAWGFFWLVLGLVLEPFEGGIKKDYATFSYFFTTSGLASAVVVAASVAMRRFGVRFGWLVKCGQNPMVAYTAAGFVIMPLLTLTHLAPYLQQFAELTPRMGVVRGVAVTVAVMGLTVVFTNRKLFWRT